MSRLALPVSEPLFERRREIVLPQKSTVLHEPEKWLELTHAVARDRGERVICDAAFERWLEALRVGDVLAYRGLEGLTRAGWFIQSGRFSAPYTNTYNSGSGTDVALTSPAQQCVVRCGGGGGGGGTRSSSTLDGSGGGGGGQALKTITSIAPGDQSAYSVGASAAGANLVAGNGTAGNASTVNTGTGAFTGINLSGNGGGAGQQGGTASAGGTATGGDTNTSGAAGNSTDGLSGGKAGGGANGGAGGANADNTTPAAATAGSQAAGGGGGGGGGGNTTRGSKASGAGSISYTYT